MTTTTVPTKSRLAQHLPLLVTGAIAALGVALIYRLVPDDFPDSLGGRLVLFAVALVTGPVFVVVIRWFALRIGPGLLTRACPRWPVGTLRDEPRLRMPKQLCCSKVSLFEYTVPECQDVVQVR